MKAEYLDPKQDIPANTSAGATTASTALTTTTNDGASIEVVRRPRGRPPGSKNKPKPPVIITPDPPMSPYILEIPSGNDLVEAASKFCRRRNLGLCVLAASGAVSNFTLRQPCTTPAANITFHGRFDILSISGTFLPPQATPCSSMPNGFSLSLAGPQGQIVGGLVAGPLVAAGSVFLVVATFSNPVYHRLTAEDEERRGGVSSEGNGQSSPGVSGGEQAPLSGGGVQTPESSTGGASMYSCHMPSDVMWTPPAHHVHGPRHPPPHHHPPPY